MQWKRLFVKKGCDRIRWVSVGLLKAGHELLRTGACFRCRWAFQVDTEDGLDSLSVENYWPIKWLKKKRLYSDHGKQR